MKKINNNGFMLAELLSVTVVILVVFTAIFINFYPTVGEYEKRIEYNDVDSLYAEYYFKVFLLKYFDANLSTASTIIGTIGSNGYYSIVSKDICTSTFSYGSFTCSDLITKYKISEVILTNYSPSDEKIKNCTSCTTSFLNYIESLSIVSNSDLGEVYRIIIKTKTGYATDQFYAKICDNNNKTWSCF